MPEALSAWVVDQAFGIAPVGAWNSDSYLGLDGRMR